MPCDSMWVNQEQRRKAEAAKAKLEADIAAGRVQIVRTPTGEYGVVNWGAQEAAKVGWCEGCVLRSIQQGSNWLAKTKLAQAGMTKAPFRAVTHGGHDH